MMSVVFQSHLIYMKLDIQDNFLEEEYFRKMQEAVHNPDFPWGWQSDVARNGENKDKHFYFVHPMFEMFTVRSNIFENCLPFLKQLDVRALCRMRILMYVNQGEQIIHEKHIDYPYKHKASLLYLNTNNGFTEFVDGRRVESVENRLVTFDGSKEHSSSTCTDQKVRTVLAINYF